MKTITVLFLILLPILLSAEYEPEATVKYPFETTIEYYDSLNDTLIISADSLGRSVSLRITIYDSLGHFAVDSGTTNDSGFVNLTFDNWNNGSPIDTLDIDSVIIEFPDLYRYDSITDEFKNDVIYTVGSTSGIYEVIKEYLEEITVAPGVFNRKMTIGQNDQEFTFAIMADMHIGEGSKNFQGGSYNDAWNRYVNDDDAEEAIERNIKVRDYINTQQLKFVIALGDITNSAERAELECARELILENLEVPYIPVFGNHDTWSYYSSGDYGWTGETRSYYPCGNSFKIYGFGDYYENLKTLPPFGNWNECYHLNNIAENVSGDHDSYFFNFSFDYQNYHFICTDWNSRGGALWGKGGSLPGANLYDPTWNWFWNDFDNANIEDRKIIIIAHHPLITHWGFFAFDSDEILSFYFELLNRDIDYFDFWFGGHTHTDKSSTDRNFVAKLIEVGASMDGWCKTVTVKDEFFLDLQCTLNPSGQNYILEGIVNGNQNMSNQYSFHLLEEDNLLEGTGEMIEPFNVNSPGTKTITLDAIIIFNKHYTITKAFEIPYVNYLVLQNETVNTTETYQATNYIEAEANFTIASSGDVTMEAGNTIYLKPGFEARNGCEFAASINSSLKDNPPSLSSMTEENLTLSIPETGKPEEMDSKKTSAELSSKETKESIPKVFSCAQNHPNPFMRNTTIKYGLPKNCDNVNLTIFNLAGQAVKTLVNGQQSAGFKSVSWDGTNSTGVQVPQGIYFYVFKADDFEDHRKMVLIK